MNNILKRTGVLLALATVGIGLAHAELVVVVNAKSSVSSMTAAEVADVFLGRNNSLSPIDLPDAAPQKADFYSKVAGKDNAQVKAIWSRLVFTGKSQPPKEVATSADAVKQVASNEKAIAYVDKSAVDASVKTVLTVN